MALPLKSLPPSDLWDMGEVDSLPKSAFLSLRLLGISLTILCWPWLLVLLFESTLVSALEKEVKLRELPRMAFIILTGTQGTGGFLM